ncbi:hypothetical protein E2C01_016665 [Portunus trituberculatus]|uniref:Uncharacterized protein n=1 Tax=Portunus trituberculatus TaxID=210409 RepID=A0A5B7DQG2_PORTR|nr:hypothetical protein [Portunus trituberculatus]
MKSSICATVSNTTYVRIQKRFALSPQLFSKATEMISEAQKTLRIRALFPLKLLNVCAVSRGCGHEEAIRWSWRLSFVPPGCGVTATPAKNTRDSPSLA